MFGYLKFYRELGGTHFNQFKKNYCYLCRSLDKKYGLISRLVLSYDTTLFLCAVTNEDYLSKIKTIGCVNKLSDDYGQYEFTDKIAALNLLLAAAKCEDDIVDENSLKARLAGLLFAIPFSKAKKRHPEMWKLIKERYSHIRELELNNASLNELEEYFSNFMIEIAITFFDLKDQSMIQLSYFACRWLYFIDAFDDYEKDIKKGRFNPLKFETNTLEEKYFFFNKHMEELFELIKGIRHSKDINNQIVFKIAVQGIPLTNFKILKSKR